MAVLPKAILLRVVLVAMCSIYRHYLLTRCLCTAAEPLRIRLALAGYRAFARYAGLGTAFVHAHDTRAREWIPIQSHLIANPS